MEDIRERLLPAWTTTDSEAFGVQPILLQHHLHELDLFSQDALLALLDSYPPERLQAFTMGQDPLRREQWQPVSCDGVSGKDLFGAVQRGRLWLNLLRADLADRRYAELVGRLHAGLSAQCPSLGLLSITFATLIISSPDAMVYYHADGPSQVLWHIQGAKRVWVYPVDDARFAPPEIIEEIMAGTYEYDEELPYSSDFDAHARVFDLKPGDVLSWPHNAPHRVVNLGTLNVSLSTGLATKAVQRRKLVISANGFFRQRLRIPVRSSRAYGLAAEAKCLAYRLLRRAGFDPPRPRPPYQPRLRIDPDSPLGVS
jgi:hypothetical protein